MLIATRALFEYSCEPLAGKLRPYSINSLDSTETSRFRVEDLVGEKACLLFLARPLAATNAFPHHSRL